MVTITCAEAQRSHLIGGGDDVVYLARSNRSIRSDRFGTVHATATHTHRERNRAQKRPKRARQDQAEEDQHSKKKKKKKSAEENKQVLIESVLRRPLTKRRRISGCLTEEGKEGPPKNKPSFTHEKCRQVRVRDDDDGRDRRERKRVAIFFLLVICFYFPICTGQPAVSVCFQAGGVRVGRGKAGKIELKVYTDVYCVMG